MKKALFGILLAITTGATAKADATFGNVRDVIKSSIGVGFSGVNVDRKDCSVQVKYNEHKVALTLRGYHGNGALDSLELVATPDSDELVVSDQSSSTNQLIYITASTYVQTTPRKKIDRRRLTIRKSGVSLQYMTKHNSTGTTRGLECKRR